VVRIILLHELPVGHHDLGDTLQGLGLDRRVFIPDHSKSNLLA
jgi:hypothetical protein